MSVSYFASSALLAECLVSYLSVKSLRAEGPVSYLSVKALRAEGHVSYLSIAACQELRAVAYLCHGGRARALLKIEDYMCHSYMYTLTLASYFRHRPS